MGFENLFEKVRFAEDVEGTEAVINQDIDSYVEYALSVTKNGFDSEDVMKAHFFNFMVDYYVSLKVFKLHSDLNDNKTFDKFLVKMYELFNAEDQEELKIFGVKCPEIKSPISFVDQKEV